jgi:hypothetical protein
MDYSTVLFLLVVRGVEIVILFYMSGGVKGEKGIWSFFVYCFGTSFSFFRNRLNMIGKPTTEGSKNKKNSSKI